MSQSDIKEAFERKVRAMTARPFIAQGTATTRVTLDKNLRCNVQDGDWHLVVDMHSNYAGDNAGPNPGVLARGALGSCLTIGYAMWAARLGVVFDQLEVIVEADYDARGEFAVADDVDPGYLALRYTVRVASDAPDEEVIRVLNTADRYSSIRDVFARAIPIERTVDFVDATTPKPIAS
jgi:uncharacterized OsmC-like protein